MNWIAARPVEHIVFVRIADDTNVWLSPTVTNKRKAGELPDSNDKDQGCDDAGDRTDSKAVGPGDPDSRELDQSMAWKNVLGKKREKCSSSWESFSG